MRRSRTGAEDRRGRRRAFRSVAEGLLFHMPDRRRLLFDVERGGRTERLSTDIVPE